MQGHSFKNNYKLNAFLLLLLTAQIQHHQFIFNFRKMTDSTNSPDHHESFNNSKTNTEMTADGSDPDRDVEKGPEGTELQLPTPGEVTVITSLNGYEGQNQYEKLDSFIAAHPVAMVNRSWCLFSIDAVDFLSRMGVSVHSLEIDLHPHGNELAKYLKKKLSYDT